MINGQEMRNKTYIKTHMIQAYDFDEVMQHRGSVTLEAFNTIKQKIISSVFEAK